jgi:predicted transposase YdaD
MQQLLQSAETAHLDMQYNFSSYIRGIKTQMIREAGEKTMRCSDTNKQRRKTTERRLKLKTNNNISIGWADAN